MDRELLFGVLAVQTGLATPQQVMTAASASLIDDTQRLPARLLEAGVLKERQVALLEQMVDEAVKAHGGDVHRTLRSLGGEQAVLKSFGGAIQLDAPADGATPGQHGSQAQGGSSRWSCRPSA